MKKFFIYSFLFFIFMINCLFSAEFSQDFVLMKLKENKTKILNLKFKFTQEIKSNIDDENYPKIIGEIYFKPPYKFKISYNDNKFLYLFNGETLFFYDKIKNQILEKDKNDDDFLGIDVINFVFLDDNFLKNFDITSFWQTDDKNCNFSFLDKKNNDKIFLTVNSKNFFPEKIVWDKEFTKIFIFISSLQYNTKNISDMDFEITKYIKNKNNLDFLKI